MRHILKRDKLAYLKAMREALEPILGPAIPNDCLPDHYSWKDVETKFGKLDYVNIDAEFYLFSMETRFADPNAVKGKLRQACNPYSGKWNHYADKDAGPRAAAVFMLGQLLEVIPAVDGQIAKAAA